MTDRNAKKEQFHNDNGGQGRGPVKWIVALVLVAGAALAGWSLLGQQAGGYPELRAESGEVRIPISRINDGNAHFFSYKAGESTIKFFVLQSRDGVIRAALDTCDVCYREQKGYRQEGNMMVCNNCDMQFAANRINEVKGGCNPAPINRRVQDDHLVIAAADLAAGSWYFAPSGR